MMDSRKQLEYSVAQMLKEAERLGIAKEEIIAMIAQEEEDHA